MSENHSLYTEFPNHIDRIQELKSANPDFARAAAEYHKLDHQIRGLHMRSQPVDDQTMKGLKRQRAQLKDELYNWLCS
ncbi:DUF465 domain-containing protein [Gallaecimonas kandeliae]|uniref:YdcH family protein n=1 Tax=Gallaecimonas kandeliae TaxID=3029055 RepID=UPI002649C94C|nr:DUF465 domain-containing protein [Gallaecimonas kandeliae]WKE65353.1 DUF465 domain-containing protein [Gallaecimonas kandeliae]